MNLSLWRRLLPAAALLALAPLAWSQPASPHVGYVYPAGGKQGSTFKLQLGGQFFDGATGVRVSGEGVTAKVLGQTKPITMGQANALRMKMEDLEKKEKKTDADRKEIDDIREKLAEAENRPTPALAEVVTVEVTIDEKAAAGSREIRLAANTGLSNPVVFEIGTLPEVTQKKEYLDPEGPIRQGTARFAKPRKEYQVITDTTVTLPTVLNSQIMPGEVDRYHFTATKGQQLVFVARARALIPYLADAVPGWFQAAMSLYDASGNEVAFCDDYRHHPDPVLFYKVAKDGEYVLEIRDSIYRGREDFVYRIEAGELPFITGVFPLGGPAKTKTTVTLEGWNLPQTSLALEPADMKPGVIQLSVTSRGFQSNRMPFAVTNLPEITEQESNNSLATAQKITLPVIINGRIDQPGDTDVFQFQGRAGETIIAEVAARRLDSPLDSAIKITDAKGKVIGFNDDQPDKGQGLNTHHADSYLKVTLPAEGVYFVHIADTRRHGSSAHAYRLRVSAPRPDFELRVTPCSINARPGSTVPITVVAVRKDGFAGEINLGLKYLPVDFKLTGSNKIPANQEEVRLTLDVPATAREKPINLAIEGKAMCGQAMVTRLATPAEDMMQAFAYHHLVPVHDMMVTVSGRAMARFPARLVDRGPIKILPGGTALVRFQIPRAGAGERIQVILSDPPEGISLKNSAFAKDIAVLQIEADSDKVRPGMRGNLIVEAYPAWVKKPGGGAAGGKSQSLGVLPAVPFEIRRALR
ncbi:MAG: PPC domain-containing protein [Gemmataceae bacterium]